MDSLQNQFYFSDSKISPSNLYNAELRVYATDGTVIVMKIGQIRFEKESTTIRSSIGITKAMTIINAVIIYEDFTVINVPLQNSCSVSPGDSLNIEVVIRG